MSRHHASFPHLPLALFLALAGCKAGGPGGGPPPDFAVNVVVAPATEKAVTDSIELVGTLQANERIEVKSEISGLVSRIGFDEGQPVTSGQVLFELNAEKLAAQVESSRANFAVAEANLKRAETLQQGKAISQQEFDQSRNSFEVAKADLALTERQLRDTVITAPFGGTAGARMVSPGQYVQFGQELATLVDTDPLKADFAVPERFIGQLAKEQKVEVTASAYAGEKFSGQVYFIAPEVDDQTRTVQVRARVPNADGRLRPGMFTALSLVLTVREKALTIPETAIVQQGDQAFVMAVDKVDKVDMRPVKVGLRKEGEAEITSGLAAGDRVITEGHQKVGPGAKVNPKPAG